MSPAYAASSAALPIDAIYPGDSAVVWNAERPLTGAASKALAITPNPAPFGGPINISVEINFSATPGAFEIRVQTADTDTDNAYQTEASGGTITLIGGDGSGFYVRTEIAVKAKFVRLLMKTQSANAANVTAKISR
jgi:hypothetical protein